MIDWSKITPEEFEELCAELLEMNSFSNIEWYGKGGGDKGRDILASRFDEPVPGTQYLEKWLIQCKRYTKRTLTKLDLETLFASAREHAPHTVLLMYTGALTADVRDWIKSVEQSYSFRIIIWEERDLESQIRRHHKKLSKPPKLLPQRNEPIRFYHTEVGKHYMCNEVEEVGFVVYNSFSRDSDIGMIHDFIEFIRNNELVLDEEIDNRDEDGD